MYAEYKTGDAQTTVAHKYFKRIIYIDDQLQLLLQCNSTKSTQSSQFMEEDCQKTSHERPTSLWKRLITDNARFRIVKKTLTRKDKRKEEIENGVYKNDASDQQSFRKSNHLKVEYSGTAEKMVTRKEGHFTDGNSKTSLKTLRFSTQSPESRRNAICEMIEKQSIEEVRNHEVSLTQRRDCLRVEYVLREVCLL